MSLLKHFSEQTLVLCSVKCYIRPVFYLKGGFFMKNCIFCSIIAGELPCTRVYEDDLVFAFMDIAPINPGHILIIPREHHTSSSTIPEATAGRMFHTATRLGIAAKRTLDIDGFNLHLADGTCAGQVVMHAHLHMIPRFTDDGFHWNWRQKKYTDDAERNQIASKIIEKLKLQGA